MTDLKKLAEEYCAPYTADHWSLKDVRRNAYLAGARAGIEAAAQEAETFDARIDVVVGDQNSQRIKVERGIKSIVPPQIAARIRSLLPEVST